MHIWGGLLSPKERGMGLALIVSGIGVIRLIIAMTSIRKVSNDESPIV